MSFVNSSRPIQESVVQPPQDVQGSDQIKSHPVLPTQASGHDQTKQLHAHLVDPHWSHQVLPISSPCSSREPVLPNGAKEENSNSQREGRQNPFKMDEKNKQEPKAKKQPAMETPELHPPMSLQAMPCDLPTALGPSQTPAAEGNQTVGAMPHVKVGGPGNSSAETEAASAAKLFHTELFGRPGQTKGRPKGSNQPQSHVAAFLQPNVQVPVDQLTNQATHSNQGGITAFATKASKSQTGEAVKVTHTCSTQVEGKPGVFPTAPGPHSHDQMPKTPQPKGLETIRESMPQGSKAEVGHKPSTHNHCSPPDDQPSFTQQIEGEIESIEAQGETVASKTNCISHLVQLFQDDFAKPYNVSIDQDATVGSVTVAEVSLGTMAQPVRVSSCMGTPVKLAECTSPMQQLFLHRAGIYEPGVAGHIDAKQTHPKNSGTP